METVKKHKIQAQENQTVSFHGLETTFKVLSRTVHGSASVLENILDPKYLGAPLHKHTLEDEILYILEGELSVIQDGEVKSYIMGEYVTMPRGKFHTYWNSTDVKVRFIRIYAPGDFENYFAQMALSYHPGKEPNFENIAETALEYGLEFKWGEHEDLIKKYNLKRYLI